MRQAETLVVRVGGAAVFAVSCALLIAFGGCSSTAKGTTSTDHDNSGSVSAKNTNSGGGDVSNSHADTDDHAGDDSNSGSETVATNKAGTKTNTKTTVNASATNTRPRALGKRIAAAKKLKTTKSVAAMSKFLVKPAEREIKRKRFAVAIPLLEGLVAARGEGDDYNYKLGIAWSDQGDYTQAVRVLNSFIAATNNGVLRGRATRARDNLAKAENPFAKQFQRNQFQSRRYASMAFRKGRVAFRHKHYADALIYYRMGLAINPLAGFLRELGATYDKLHMRNQKIKFYYRYLHRRPFGKNANMVRKALGKTKGLLSPLTIKSALECQELWINGQKLRRVKLPMKNVLVAPGKYRGLCLNYKYNFGMFENSFVKKGRKGALEFRWALLVNRLENPMGRLRLEDARTGQMHNLALVPKTVGVVVPKSGRALKLVKTSLNRAKTATQYIRLQPGQKHVIKW